MPKLSFILLFSFSLLIGCAQGSKTKHNSKTTEISFKVDGKDFYIKGMNWTYYPIGTNYEYNIWDQSDEYIISVLQTEMTLLQQAGINAIRVYANIPPRWVTYIHKNYGIYSVVNHTFGRYGMTIENEWIKHTDYANPPMKKQLIEEITEVVETYKGTPGLLMYLLGNENNYGLFWDGAETENIPTIVEELRPRAVSLYQLFNEASLIIKERDKTVPVAICNGDLMYLDEIVKECSDIDILGINIYRGISFTGVFSQFKKEWDKPLMFTEFGCDAFDSKENKEDQKTQAEYIKNNLKEIYENAPGVGLENNCIGAFTFQFSDGWWKTGQKDNLNIHDSTASWVNEGYKTDFVEGKNNINEEWLGICAKEPLDSSGRYSLLPRAAYYILKEANRIDPYAENVTLETIQQHFETIKVNSALDSAATVR